jgi:anti-sigma-K factor RskA
MMSDEDRIVLAAEYVLGTLDAAERTEAEELAGSDAAFAALVQVWERRLGELNTMVDPVEPPPELWDAIRSRIAGTEPAPLRLPEIPAVSPPPPAAAAAEGRNVVAFRRSVGRWRGATAVMSALAASLAAVIVTGALAPERLPAPLRPRPQVVEVVKTVEVPAPAPARFVAVLKTDPAAPAFILTVDPANRSLTIRRVSAEEQAGKSYELWLVSDRFGAPRSLGLVGTAEFAQQKVAYDPATISSATYAVSLEPEGGSPTGAPTGPVLWSGKPIEAEPATQAH